MSTRMPVIHMSASSILGKHPVERAVLPCIFRGVADNLSGNIGALSEEGVITAVCK